MLPIRKIAFWLVTLGALGAGATSAFADGYRGPARRYAPPPFSWTGFYMGGTVGYAWANSEHCDRADCSGGAPTFPEPDPRGAFVGLTAGYNYQVSSNIVIGIEGDYNFAHLKATVPSTATFGCAGGCTTELGNFGTIRGRVGYAYGTSLAYFTAGVAFTEWKGKIGIPTLQSGSSTETSAVIGGGFEYAFAPRWSAKIEYLHIFEGDTFVYAPAFCASPGCQIKNEDVDLVRLGLNFRLY
jgi:outer membrane immunogenic protein